MKKQKNNFILVVIDRKTQFETRVLGLAIADLNRSVSI